MHAVRSPAPRQFCRPHQQPLQALLTPRRQASGKQQEAPRSLFHRRIPDHDRNSSRRPDVSPRRGQLMTRHEERNFTLDKSRKPTEASGRTDNSWNGTVAPVCCVS